jgi:hypothetical protein
VLALGGCVEIKTIPASFHVYSHSSFRMPRGSGKAMLIKPFNSFGGEEGGPDSQTMHFMTTSLLKHDQGSKMPFHYVHPIRVLFYTPFRVLVYLPFVC